MQSSRGRENCRFVQVCRNNLIPIEYGSKAWFMVLCGLAVLLSYLPVSGDGRLQPLRSQQHEQPLPPKSATVIAVWRYWRAIGKFHSCSVSPVRTFSRTISRSSRQIARNKVAFMGITYPSRYADLIDDAEQRAFCCLPVQRGAKITVSSF